MNGTFVPVAGPGVITALVTWAWALYPLRAGSASDALLVSWDASAASPAAQASRNFFDVSLISALLGGPVFTAAEAGRPSAAVAPAAPEPVEHVVRPVPHAADHQHEHSADDGDLRSTAHLCSPPPQEAPLNMFKRALAGTLRDGSDSRGSCYRTATGSGRKRPVKSRYPATCG